MNQDEPHLNFMHECISDLPKDAIEIMGIGRMKDYQNFSFYPKLGHFIPDLFSAPFFETGLFLPYKKTAIHFRSNIFGGDCSFVCFLEDKGEKIKATMAAKEQQSIKFSFMCSAGYFEKKASKDKEFKSDFIKTYSAGEVTYDECQFFLRVALNLLSQFLYCISKKDYIERVELIYKKRALGSRIIDVVYKTKVLKIEPSSSKKPTQNGTHASPVSHLRRGHIRNLKDGRKVFVSETMVNAEKSFLNKEYRV